MVEAYSKWRDIARRIGLTIAVWIGHGDKGRPERKRRGSYKQQTEEGKKREWADEA